MKMQKLLAAVAVGSSMVFSGVLLADSKEARPAEKPAAEAKPVKLVKPWSDLKSLTDDQKAKIDAIHKKALAEINAIEKKEKEDITALLTDANKAELKDLAESKKKADAAKKAPAEKKPEAKPEAK